MAGLVQQTWKPQVAPVGPMPMKPATPGQTFTQTSLKKEQPVKCYLCPLKV
jgi:hypothetical protein